MPFAATWMDLETVIPRDWREWDRERQILYHLYMESKKKSIQMNLLMKQK